jgi:hypothetical protein
MFKIDQKSLYCPICFSQSLRIKKQGVVHIKINQLQMDTGKVLFNFSRPEDLQETRDSILQKIESFFQWYSQLKNIKSIESIDISSNDFRCDQNCKIPIHARFPVDDFLLDKEKYIANLKELGKKYSLPLDL